LLVPEAHVPRPALADPFEALGDPNRRAILALIVGEGRSVGDIARRLPISRPAVSRHLRLLREAGLVSETAVGTRRIYRLQGEGLAAVEHYLRQVWGEAAGRFTVATAKRDAGRPAGRR
jgi:DNA-binding transcriptional ArsR family regulator